MASRIADQSLEIGGAEEARTLDPHVANVVLYQLSYRPVQKELTVYLIGNTV